MQFGPSSEKLARHIDQLELRLEDLETNRASKPIIAGTTDGSVSTTGAPATAGGVTA